MAFAAVRATLVDVTQLHIGGPKGLPVALQSFGGNPPPTGQFVLCDDGFHWRDPEPILASRDSDNSLQLIHPAGLEKNGCPDGWKILEGDVLIVCHPTPALWVGGTLFSTI